MSKVQKISISLPKELVDDIRHAVDSGLYATASEVVREAVREWNRNEEAFPPGYPVARTRKDLIRMIKEGIAAGERGDVKPAEEVFKRLEAKYATTAAVERRGKRRR